MTDTLSPEIRSQIMAKVRSYNTGPELIIRRQLHRKGYRFRLHDKKLPGRPDIVLPKYNAVILINGCFWHGHDCDLFNMPKTRKEFWQKKISRTRERDNENVNDLLSYGWRVLTIWQCSMKGKSKRSEEEVIHQTVCWLSSKDQIAAIKGKQ